MPQYSGPAADIYNHSGAPLHGRPGPKQPYARHCARTPLRWMRERAAHRPVFRICKSSKECQNIWDKPRALPAGFFAGREFLLFWLFSWFLYSFVTKNGYDKNNSQLYKKRGMPCPAAGWTNTRMCCIINHTYKYAQSTPATRDPVEICPGKRSTP